MTETKSGRGRPRLAPEDNETRERILNTAQRLFAEKGFGKVSLRELTTAADTNLAAVNYYFGSKDQLLAALIRRAAKVVHRQRMVLLDEALAADGDVRTRATRILHALLAPAIGSSSEHAESNFLYSTLLARCMNEDAPDLSQVLEKETSHLVPFAQALHQLLPDLPIEDLHWRLHFILNIEHAVHTETGRLTHMSSGLCDTGNRQLMLDKILAFVIPGLLAD